MDTRPIEETNPTNGRERSNVEAHSPDDEKPRVVDKRRFRRLLEEETPAGELLPEPPRYPSYVEELQNKLQAGEARLLEYAEQMRQARQQMDAELDAIRDRLRRNMQEQLDQGKAQFVEPMLDVLDNLNRAIQAAEATQNFDGLLNGIKVTTAMFERHLQSLGVVLIGSPGEPFDPRFHEAVESVPVEPERDGLIVEVLQPGYRLGEVVLIRPARVRVGQS